MRYKIFLSLFFTFVVASCCRVPPPDGRNVTALVAERIQKAAYWERLDCKPTQDAICFLLSQELTVDAATQIALLNNPEVQALFAEIGIAHADLIEAGLFRNPIFDGYVRFPDQAGLVLNTQFSIAQTFLDIFLVPLKKKVASAALEQTKLRVANAILDLAFSVQETFFAYVAQSQKISLLELLVETTDIAKSLAILQYKQGNINELELQMRLQEALQTSLFYAESQAEWIGLREKMNQLMGLSTDLCWSAHKCLPELLKVELPCVALQEIALARRLDISIARWEMERLFRFWKTKHWWAFADGAFGVSTEQEAENFRETGPIFTVPLPFFNYGQADRARINALYAQSCNRLKALEISTLAEVRAAKGQLDVYRALVRDYQEKLLPLQEAIVSSSQLFYNAMALGVYKLIQAKKQEIEIEIQYTGAQLHYWISQVNLDRAMGGNLFWGANQMGLNGI